MKNAFVLTCLVIFVGTASAQQRAFVQVAAATPQTSQASVALPFPSAQTSGNLNAIVVGWNDVTSTVSSVTDSLGNSYVKAIGPTKSTGISQSIYYAKNIIGGSNTVTVQFNQAAAAVDLRILEYSGLDKSNPMDVASAATGSNASPDSGSATTTSNGDLIFGAGTTFTTFSGAGSGFTSRIITSPDGDIAEDKVITGVGSFSASAPLGSAGDWVMQMVAFRAAGASGVVTTVSPATDSLQSGGTQQFTATVTGSNNTAVTWSASAGSVSSTGLFTAPTVTGFAHITVTATSVSDKTSSASASVTVHPPFAAYPLKASANKRYFVDQNNVPFLLVGDSPQALITNISEANASAYFADRASNGFNALWINLLCDTYTFGNANGTTFDGIAPFTTGNSPSNYDLSTPNPTYFARADDMINLAAQNGLVVFLDPIETGGWTGALENNGTAKAFNYGVFVGNRYKNFPNIVWLSGNDFQSWRSSSTDNNLVKQVMAGIASVDSNHLQTIELDYDISFSNQDALVVPYLGCDFAYTYFETYDMVLQGYNSTPISPVFMGEANYEFENNTGAATGTILDQRLQEYWVMTSGASGQFYGNHFTTDCSFVTQGNLDTPGMVQLQYSTALFSSVNWWQLVPDQTHTVVTAGYGTYNANNAAIGNANYATTAWIPNGSLAITFCPKQTTLTVNMSKFGGATTAQWYDPTNGKYSTISGSPFSNSGSRQFATPGTNSGGGSDWALVLTSSTSGLNPPVITAGPTATPNPVQIGKSIAFGVTASDPNGQTLSYTWSFGDGTTATGASPSHTYSTAATYSVSVTVTDTSGLSTTGNIAVVVNGGNSLYVQGNYATPQTSQSTIATSYTSAQIAGNTNIVAIGWNDATTNISSVTDSSGNTYQVAAATLRGNALSQAIYYAKSIKAAAAGINVVTVQFSAAAAFPDVRIFEYSGLDKTNPFDVSASAAGSGITADSGHATTTSASELIFGAGMTAGTFTGGQTGFTVRVITQPDSDIGEDEVVAATGSYNATATGTSASWVMQMATFRLAASSGVSVSISPTTATLASAATQQFAATVTGSTNTAVTWSASAGTISSAGLFTAPTVSTFTTVTVTATSVADSTVSAGATVTVHPPFAKYPLKASTNKRYFVDQNNVPFLLVADSPQALMTNLSEAQASAYFIDRAANGFNGLWINLLCDTYTAGNANGTTFDGIAPFTTGTSPSNYDLSTPNPAYFARIDDMLNLAAQNGLVVFLDPIETGGWTGTLENNGTTKAFNYGVYVGNRYKNFPNIIWLSGNDFQSWKSSSTDNNLVKQVMAGIASVDTNHLQTIELDYNMSYSNQDSLVVPYLGCDFAYTYYETYDSVLQAYNSTPTSPVFMGESNYEFENNTGAASGTVLDERLQEYWLMTSGATGQIYGNHYTWTCTFTTQAELDTLGVVQLQYGTAFFSSVHWWQLVPDQTHAVVTAGFGTYNGSNSAIQNSNYVTTAWIPDGSVSISYCPKQTTLTVNMSKMAGATTARWYDPTNGKYTAVSGSPFANSGSRQFTTPGANSSGDHDWVLILTSSSNSNPAPVITTPASANPNPTTVGQPVTFSVGASDSDGDTLTYSWAFGDNSSGSGSSTTHTYTSSGSFTATVTVSDGHGNSVSSSVTVNVNALGNHPPVITSAATANPSTALTGETITFTVAASDPDNDPLTYSWAFGDGSTGSGSTATHAYTSAGTFTATATVSDGRGGTASSLVPVTITAPVTVAFVQQNSSTPQTPQSTVSVIYNAPQGAGDTNILAIGWNDTKASISSVKDSSGNVYSVAAATARGTNLSHAIYYAKNIKAAVAGANTVTVTFNAAAVYPDVRILEYSGLDATSPFDVAASHAGSGASASSGAATTHSAAELIFGAGMTLSTFTGPGSGFITRVITSPDGDIAEDKVVSTTGSYTTTAPNNSGYWLMQMATFKIASSAPAAATAAATAAIDLGTFKQNHRFKAKLPASLTGSKGHAKLAKGSSLPKGVKVGGTSIGGLSKIAGTFSFDVQISAKGGSETYTCSLTIEP